MRAKVQHYERCMAANVRNLTFQESPEGLSAGGLPPTRSCTRRARVLPRRRVTADGSHDRHRRAWRSLPDSGCRTMNATGSLVSQLGELSAVLPEARGAEAQVAVADAVGLIDIRFAADQCCGTEIRSRSAGGRTVGIFLRYLSCHQCRFSRPYTAQQAQPSAPQKPLRSPAGTALDQADA